MRGMPGSFDDEPIASPLDGRLYAVELVERSVFVVAPLQEQDGTRQPCDLCFDVPVGEFGGQPDVTPSRVQLPSAIVVALESGDQGAGISIGPLDSFRGCRLHVDMRCNEHETTDGSERCVDERDGRPVRMADQHGRFDPEGRQHSIELIERGIVEVAHRPGPICVTRSAMPPTVVHDSAASGCAADCFREPSPQLDRPEAFVEEYEIGRAGTDQLALERGLSDLDALAI